LNIHTPDHATSDTFSNRPHLDDACEAAETGLDTISPRRISRAPVQRSQLWRRTNRADRMSNQLGRDQTARTERSYRYCTGLRRGTIPVWLDAWSISPSSVGRQYCCPLLPDIYPRTEDDEVLQRTGLTSLYHLLSRRRISVFGHVAGLDDDTPANMALQLHINVSLYRPPDRTWRRPPGHQRNKWLDQLRPATKRFHPSDWGALEACCRP